MPLYRLTELQAFLSELGRGAKRTLSQNFLIDGNIVRSIVKHVDVSAGDRVVEIGPGPGVLTEALLDQGIHVVAIELDSDFATHLPRLVSKGKGELTVIESDVRKVFFPELIDHTYSSKQVVHVVSNIPYHLTKEILLAIATGCRHPFQAVLMVQEEVARKLAFHPPSHSLLSTQLNLYGKITYLERISRHCFYPEPHVDSALICFRSHPPLLLEEQQSEFFSLLSLAYQHRRKSILGVLASKKFAKREELEKLLCEKGIASSIRPDELSLSQWVELFLHIRAFA